MKKQRHIYRWIKEDFARAICLLERTDTMMNRGRFKSCAQADIYQLLVDGWRIHALEAVERQASWLRIEHRFPFNDQRLVEFAMALPEEQRWRANKIKFILRNAMRELLPDSVQQRTSKAEFSPVMMQVLTTQAIQNIFNLLPDLFSKWTKGEWILSMHREMYRSYAEGNQTCIFNIWVLWNTFAIYLWLNTVFPDYSQPK